MKTGTGRSNFVVIEPARTVSARAYLPDNYATLPPLTVLSEPSLHCKVMIILAKVRPEQTCELLRR